MHSPLHSCVAGVGPHHWKPLMKPQTILIAGPYRSGTGGDARLIEANLKALELAAWQVYRKGHLPLIGEWAALPLAAAAGLGGAGAAVPSQFLYDVAARMIARCDGVYRIAGASAGADGDVRRARELGLPCYDSLDQLADADPAP